MSANGLGNEVNSKIYDAFLLQLLEETADIICDSRGSASAITRLQLVNNLLQGALAVAKFQDVSAGAPQSNRAFRKQQISLFAIGLSPAATGGQAWTRSVLGASHAIRPRAE